MLNWKIQQQELELAYNWKISRNETNFKTNFIVEVSDGKFTGLGEAAPNIRYGETPERLLSEFELFTDSGAGDSLKSIMQSDISNSLKFAIESAWIHLQCKAKNISVPQYLNIPAAIPVATSYTIPIMEITDIEAFINLRNLKRFESLKIKVNKENAEDLIKEVYRIKESPLRIDANEAWENPEELIKLLEKIKNVKIEFIEQPFPSNLVEEYKYLKKVSKHELMADESITDNAEDIINLVDQFHGINMKLMKAGGYTNGLRIIQEARRLGLKTMIGCMVETTLGISSAMNLSSQADYFDLDGHFILKNEIFNLINEHNGILIQERKIYEGNGN